MRICRPITFWGFFFRLLVILYIDLQATSFWNTVLIWHYTITDTSFFLFESSLKTVHS